MGDLWANVTFSAAMAATVAQVVPVLFIAIAVQIHAIAKNRKRKWTESKYLVRLLGAYAAIGEIGLLVAVGLDGLSGSTALGAWFWSIGLVLTFIAVLALSFEATIDADEEAAAVQPPRPTWKQRLSGKL